MSIKERLHLMIDDMTEEQVNDVIIYIQSRPQKPAKKKATVESLCGVLSKYAKPGLAHLEEGAWERDIAERANHGDESF